MAELSNLLAELVKQRGGNPIPSEENWFGPETQLMKERDTAQVKKLIRWSQQHDFWQTVIVDMKSMRKHYDKMLFQARRSMANSKSVDAEELLAGCQLWGSVLAKMKEGFPTDTVEMWIEPLQPHGYDGSTLNLGGPEAVRSWVKRRFDRALTEYASFVAGGPITIEYVEWDLDNTAMFQSNNGAAVAVRNERTA